MAVTAIDPVTALIVIDLQNGITALPTAHPSKEIVNKTNELIDAFHRHGLPVVLVNVEGAPTGRSDQPLRRGFKDPGWSDLVEELHAEPGDHRVTKHQWGAFTRTDLHEFLQSLGVTQVIIAGIATSIGVESTARHAHENRYNVTLAVDAMTDMSIDAHNNSIERIFPRIAETGTVRDIIDVLDRSRA